MGNHRNQTTCLSQLSHILPSQHHTATQMPLPLSQFLHLVLYPTLLSPLQIVPLRTSHPRRILKHSLTSTSFPLTITTQEYPQNYPPIQHYRITTPRIPPTQCPSTKP